MSEEKKESKIVKVKFTKHCTPYIKGDVAGLSPKDAEFYLKKDACEKLK